MVSSLSSQMAIHYVLCTEYANIVSLVDTLDHYEVPFFGHLANSFVDDE